MVKIESLIKKYDKVTAVDDISIEIGQGELYGFLGPNGAGKTTTLKMVSGMLAPDSGRVLIDGLDIQEEPELVKQNIAFIPDTPYLYEKLTGYEYLQFVAMLYDVTETGLKKELEAYIEIFRMKAWLNDRIETYSHGMRQKVVFTAAFIHNPKLMIVDEPMVGLDPISIRNVKNMMVEKCNNGLTVFMSTHTLEIAQEICSKVAIINDGRIVRTGAFDEMRSSADESLEDIFMTIVSEENIPAQ